MRVSKLIGALALVCAGPAFAGETTFNGYFRTGISYSKDLTKGVCFRENVTAVSNPGRFGNECDNLLEMIFSNYIYGEPSDTEIWTTVNVTGQLFFDGDGANELINDDNPGYNWSGEKTVFGFPQTYVEMGNALGAGSKIWVGKRWYRRILFYQSDVFTLNNNGQGFGIYDINAGPGKLHVALIRNINSSDEAGPNEWDTSPGSAGPTYNNLDIRYTMPIAGKNYDFIYIRQETGISDAYGKTDTSYRGATGDLFAVFSEYYGSYSNRFFAGYGQGLFGAGQTYHFGAGHMSYSGPGFTTEEAVETQDKSSSARIINELGLKVIDKTLDLNLSVLYSQVSKLQVGDELVDGTNMSIGVKPQYYFTENWSGVLDVTHTEQDRDDYAKKHVLTKVTLGAVLKPQIAWASGSPEFRFYYTTASWDKDANYPGDKGTYADKESGQTYGVQVDVSW